MLKKRILLISTLIALILFIAGCGTTGQTAEAVMSPYYGGTQGLVAYFQMDTNEIYEDESFPLVVILENRGEYTLLSNEVYMAIRGISPADFSGISFETSNDEEIEKVSQFLPEGDMEIFNFGDLKYDGLTGTFYDANILLEYTYPYVTYISVPRVCFKEDIKDERYCDIYGTKQAFASAGPIQVATVTQRPAGAGRIYLEIPVYNAEAGRAKAYVNDEFSNLYDEVAFEIATDGMSCTAKGDPAIARMSRITTPGEQVVIRCRSDELDPDALYTKQVDLVLSYYYQDYVSEVVRINENPELWD